MGWDWKVWLDVGEEQEWFFYGAGFAGLKMRTPLWLFWSSRKWTHDFLMGYGSLDGYLKEDSSRDIGWELAPCFYFELWLVRWLSREEVSLWDYPTVSRSRECNRQIAEKFAVSEERWKVQTNVTALELMFTSMEMENDVATMAR